ncbi:MAG: 50S ribosomal protein L24 [Candidatus Kerfeldbacteria bacterium]|jgi:large subunit ribosomal protein L24
MKIKKNDIVTVIAGKDKGKKGKVLQVFTEKELLVVEGMNMMAKNVRPKKQGAKGQVVRYNAPMNVSKVMLFCSKCNKPVRTESLISKDGKKSRICKKCKQVI